MNFEKARLNTVEQQIRPWEVLDQRVLDVILESQRDAFVPAEYQGLAYSDTRIPIGHGETMMSPKVEGRLLQALDIQPHERGLEIGTGTGYLCSLLATLSSQVVSVDIHANFTENASKRLSARGINNVELICQDACEGLPQAAPYDYIAVTGAMASVPTSLKNQLAVGGRLFIIVGKAPIMEATLIERTGEDIYTQEALFETELKYLNGAEAPVEFKFD